MAFVNPVTCAAFGQESSDPNYTNIEGEMIATFPASQNVVVTFTCAADPQFSRTAHVRTIDWETFGVQPFQRQDIFPGPSIIEWNGGDGWTAPLPADSGTWAQFFDPYPGLRSDTDGPAVDTILNDGASHVLQITFAFAGSFHYGPDGLGQDDDLTLWNVTQKLDGVLGRTATNVLTGYVPHGDPLVNATLSTLWFDSAIGWIDDLTVTYDGGGGGSLTCDFEGGTIAPFTQQTDTVGEVAFVIQCPPFGGGGRTPRADCKGCGAILTGTMERVP